MQTPHRLQWLSIKLSSIVSKPKPHISHTCIMGLMTTDLLLIFFIPINHLRVFVSSFSPPSPTHSLISSIYGGVCTSQYGEDKDKTQQRGGATSENWHFLNLTSNIWDPPPSRAARGLVGFRCMFEIICRQIHCSVSTLVGEAQKVCLKEPHLIPCRCVRPLSLAYWGP